MSAPPNSSSARRRRSNAARRLLTLRASVAGAAFAGFLGWALVAGSLAEGNAGAGQPTGLLKGFITQARSVFRSKAEALAHLSYDVPFVLNGSHCPEVCVVYLDEQSARALGQTNGPMDRRLHAQLIRKLTRNGARAVLFDMVFSSASADPAVDEDFAEAMKENGHVFIGAALELDEGLGVNQERTIPPVPVLRRAAAGWGLLTFRPVDSDYGVRQIYTGLETIPTVTWRAAVKLGAPLADTLENRMKPRWVKYYGPAGSFASCSYDRALSDNGVPDDFFRDRIVFVGGRSTLSSLAMGKDEFRSPYTSSTSPFESGVEVHLTIFLNLLRGDWLTRMSPPWELGVAIGAGLLFGGLFPLMRPHQVVAAALAGAAAILAFGFWILDRHGIWFDWAAPVLIETPSALVWAVGTRYFIEERRRTALRRAFAHYLSPAMADQISNSEIDLYPGGEIVDATIIFTDLQGFTALAEQLGDPQRLAELLNAYFTKIHRRVFENEGTIIKYIGDAVLAVWGAPFADERHASKAALAAWQMHGDSDEEVLGHRLITRVGINSGRVLAGNLGSDYRFDYTVIGDPVNFASRLEGLNKFLGTRVLLSESTHARLGDQFLTRPLGEIKVLGKETPVRVFELLGPAGAELPVWLASFSGALQAFHAGDFSRARELLLETSALRGMEDGPALFYLDRLDKLGPAPPSGWTGVVELEAK